MNHYVYQITELSTDKKYIGVRSCVSNVKDDLGIIYFSSSTDKKFINKQKQNSYNYKYEIFSLHNGRNLANEEEARLHKLYSVATNNNYYNKTSCNGIGFNPLGKMCVYDEHNILLYVNSDDKNFLNGIYRHITKNYAVMKNKNNEIVQVHVSNITDDMVGVVKGTVVVTDGTRHFRVTCNDDRINTGELTYSVIGRTHTNETKKKISDAVKGEKHPMYGKSPSDETKNKMSMARKNVKISKQTCHKISVANSGKNNPSAKKIIINNVLYDTYKDAIIALGINYKKLRKLIDSCTNDSIKLIN